MFRNYFIHYAFLLIFLWCGVVFSNESETEFNTTDASGGRQIIVSPMNIMLDLGESGYADVFVLDEDGNPIEGEEIQVVPKDETMIAINSDSFVTSESGYVYFSILGKRQGDTVVTVTDGVASTHINITTRDLIHYLIPYFYGDMNLSLINPSENINYVKIQFHENGGRPVPPVIIRLEGKEMKTLKLSEETGTSLKDGWVEILSSEIVFGGVWTNKGYLSLNRID